MSPVNHTFRPALYALLLWSRRQLAMITPEMMQEKAMDLFAKDFY
jgi:hypothetical protein